jgi:hypothetical protein
MPGSCLQNAVCDATGSCGGDPVPDGSPCQNTSCAVFAACITGQCTCLDSPDFGANPEPLLDSADMGGDGKHGRGCAMAGRRDDELFGVALLLLAFGLLRTRQRRNNGQAS